MASYPDDLNVPISRGDLSLLGISWREVEGPLWRSPYRGVHVWSATDEHDPLQRAYDASPLLPPSGALGGWAAARLGGVAEIDDWWDGHRQPVPLCLPPAVVRRRGPSVVAWRSSLNPEDVTEVDGVRVTVPVRTAFDLARRGSLLHAVTVLDLLGRGRPDFFEEVRKYAAERPGWRGVPLVRRALDLASPRTRSPRETAFRLFWLDVGLPTPEVNAVVRAPGGRLLGMVDLLDPVTGMAGEYDGAGHRAALQHALDNAREEDLEDGGLTVVRAGDIDLRGHRLRLKHRLLAGQRRAAGSRRGGWTWEPGPLPAPIPHW